MVITLGSVPLNCSHVVAAARPGVAFRSVSRVRDICISLLRDVLAERGVQQRPLAVTLQELATAYLRHASHIIINPPRMSWRRLSGVYTVRCRSGTGSSAGNTVPGYLMTRRRRNAFRRRRAVSWLIGHVIAAHMIMSALSSLHQETSDAAQ